MIFKKIMEMQKSKKIKNWVFYILLGLSIFFKNIYKRIDFIKNFNSYFDSYFEAIQIEMALTSSQIIGVAIFSVIVSILIYTFVWEFFIRFYYELVARRIGGFMKRDDFVFSGRILIICINLTIGLISLLLFAFPKLELFFSCAVDYLISFIYVVIYYRHVLKHTIGKEYKAKNTFLIAVPYFVYNAFLFFVFYINAFSAVPLDWSFFGYAVSTLIGTGIYLISILITYIAYRKQKKYEDSLPPEDPFDSGGIGGQYSAFSEFNK